MKKTHDTKTEQTSLERIAQKNGTENKLEYTTYGTLTDNTRKQPTCFHGEQLDSYVWNAADETPRKEIEEHLKTCQACYAQVTEMTAFKRLITKRFGKSQGPHPTPKEVEDFCYDRTQKQNETAILSHIVSCDKCHELFQGLRTEQKLVKEGIIPYLETPTKLPARLLEHYETYSKKDLK